MGREFKFNMTLFTVMLLVVEQTSTVKVKGYEHIPEANAWFRLHVVPAIWKDAQIQCLLEGGMLASPTTDATASAMTSIMTSHKLIVNSVFTGIDAAVFKNDFMSLDGEPLITSNLTWANGQPNNRNNAENCLVMTETGTIADVSCEKVYPYICYKDNSKICGTADEKYVFEPRTGSCYKFQRTPRTWRQAASACVAEEAHLAVINSATESLVLKEIFEENPCETLSQVSTCVTAHIGYRNWNEKGEWLTIFGIPLAEAGFEEWLQGEPNNAEGVEHCGSVTRGGLLNDVTCNLHKIASICETTAKKFY